MDCILNPNLENCKSLETQKFGLVNENHLDAISPHTENKIPPDDQKGKEKEVDDSLRSPLPLEPQTVLPISSLRSPPPEPVLSLPLLTAVIKESPAVPGCAPGSDSRRPPDPNCDQLAPLSPATKPTASDCSSCLESAGDCQAGGECGADEPSPVTPSHDEELDQRNTSSQPVIKAGPADCSAGSDETDCIPGRLQCEAGSSDPACGRQAEKGNQN